MLFCWISNGSQGTLGFLKNPASTIGSRACLLPLPRADACIRDRETWSRAWLLKQRWHDTIRRAANVQRLQDLACDHQHEESPFSLKILTGEVCPPAGPPDHGPFGPKFIPPRGDISFPLLALHRQLFLQVSDAINVTLLPPDEALLSPLRAPQPRIHQCAMLFMKANAGLHMHHFMACDGTSSS